MLYNPKWTGKPKTVGEALFRLANLIDQRGLAKRELVDKEGRVCFLGGLNVVFTDSPYRVTSLTPFTEDDWDLFIRTVNQMEDYLKHTGQVPADAIGTQVVDWNNDPRRTQEEVVNSCREAAMWDGVS